MMRFIQTVKVNLFRLFVSTKTVLSNKRGSGLLDVAITVMISVVLGALLLTGLYTLFGQEVLPTITEKIQEMFNYAG